MEQPLKPTTLKAYPLLLFDIRPCLGGEHVDDGYENVRERKGCRIGLMNIEREGYGYEDWRRIQA